MTRKEFLKISWSKYIKPVILGILLIFAINFLIDAIEAEGSERNFLLVIITLSIVVVTVLLISLVSSLLSDWVKSRMPESIMSAFRNTNKVLRILSPFVSVWVIYELYIRQNYIGMALTVWFVIQELRGYKNTEETKSI